MDIHWILISTPTLEAILAYQVLLFSYLIFQPLSSTVSKFIVKVIFKEFLGQDKLHHEQVGHNQWIRFGNGKTSAFEMTDSQINKFINDRPLIVNFIDAENKQ